MSQDSFAIMRILSWKKSVFAKCVIMILGTVVTTTAVSSYLATTTMRDLGYEHLAELSRITTDSVAVNSGGAVRFGKVDNVVGQLTEIQTLSNDQMSNAFVLDADLGVLAAVSDSSTLGQEQRGVAQAALT